MNLVCEHIQKYLEPIIQLTESNFEEIFCRINHDQKDDYRALLIYIDTIININSDGQSEQVNVLHLHIDEDLNNSSKSLIAEYLAIKQFFLQCIKDHGSLDGENKALKNEIRSLERELKRPIQLHCDTNGWAEKRIKKERKQKRRRFKFLNSLKPNTTYTPKYLFNCKIKHKNPLLESFAADFFLVGIDDFPRIDSYGLLNTNKSLNELDESEDLVDNIDTVILFDCENKSLMANFSHDEINKWNDEYGTKFSHYFILTFGKGFSTIQGCRNKIDLMRDRFKIPKKSSYTIHSSELDKVQNRTIPQNIDVEFIGIENSTFWDSFLTEASILELYELRSLKLMNVYSICYDRNIKKYIIEDIFSSVNPSKLISQETKQEIAQLSEEEIINLRDSLSNTLDLIIELGIPYLVSNTIKKNSIILIPEAALDNKDLRKLIRDSLSLFPSNKLITWSNLDSFRSDRLLILSYQDQGRFPYYFYPNVVESTFAFKAEIKALYVNFLFKQRYLWAKYLYLNDLHKCLEHSMRKKYFDWINLKSTIEQQRPNQKIDINWSLENEYTQSDSRETYRLKLGGQRSKVYNGSDLFIVREFKEKTYKVARIDSIISFDFSEDQFLAQNLDEIQENINIYERISHANQQEKELNIIRQQFQLEEEEAGRLWKVLLKRIVDSKGEESAYSEVKSFLDSKKLRMVSINQFRNSWTNPLSESLSPLSNKVFLGLCEYLNIPKLYFLIIQRIKNSSKQSSRRSSRLMNALLKDLFNDGCFDNENPRSLIKDRLSFYKHHHPLDEMGIDEDYLLENLVALVELILPEINMSKIERLIKVE